MNDMRGVAAGILAKVFCGLCLCLVVVDELS